MKVRRLHGDDGASLILALVLLSLLGIFVASALTFGAVSFENTTVTRSRAQQLYAADGGIEHAIQMVADQEWCMTADTPSQITLPEPINGKTVAVTCETTDGGLTTNSGSPLLGDYVAVVGDGGVTVTGGGWGPAEIHGSMSSGGPMSIQWNDPKDYCEDGYGPDIFEYFGLEPQHDRYECAWIDVEGSLSVAGCPPPPQHVHPTGPCTASAPAAPAVPAVRIPSNTSTAIPPADAGNGCTILYPGRYTNTSPIDTKKFFDPSKRYYLASGTYYFAGSNEVILEGQIFGGSPSPAAPWEDTQLMQGGASPCATDAMAQSKSGLSNGQPRYNAATAGTGVTIVRGSGKLRVQGQNTKIELYTRVPVAGSPDAGATPGVTVWANTNTTGTSGSQGTYTPVTNDSEIFVNSEREIDVVIHGLAYLANSRVNLTEPFNHEVGSGRGAVSFFLGGVVAKRLTITRAYDDNVQRVSLAGTGEPTESFQPRTTTVTATAQSTTGGASTTVTAVVRPDQSPAGIVTWRQG